jgi:hypothetical protein
MIIKIRKSKSKSKRTKKFKKYSKKTKVMRGGAYRYKAPEPPEIKHGGPESPRYRGPESPNRYRGPEYEIKTPGPAEPLGAPFSVKRYASVPDNVRTELAKRNPGMSVLGKLSDLQQSDKAARAAQAQAEEAAKAAQAAQAARVAISDVVSGIPPAYSTRKGYPTPASRGRNKGPGHSFGPKPNYNSPNYSNF